MDLEEDNNMSEACTPCWIVSYPVQLACSVHGWQPLLPPLQPFKVSLALWVLVLPCHVCCLHC
eukprot:4729995-Amphidinium_carterae.2